MQTKFSKRTNTVQASEVRELLKLTQTREIISFGGGLPAEETFPVCEMLEISKEVIESCGVQSMQYAASEGYVPLINAVAKLMKQKGIEADISEILITTGSQQGLDLAAKVLIDEGDVIMCESPTYLSAINAFKPFFPQFCEIMMDEKGLLPEDLETKLKENPQTKFLYTIPDFQNPTGRQMSIERRKRVIEFANKYDIIVIEDNPYGELCYDNNQMPPIKSFDTEGRVIYLSTFSKTVCPGFRIGWVCAKYEILNKFILFKQGTDLHSNIFSQIQIAKYLEKYDYQKHIEHNIDIYRSRRDAMINEIKRSFPKSVKYTCPSGGLFLWVTLPEDINSRELLPKALDRGVAFVSGEAFYPNGGHKNTMRLNFSGVREDKITKGIAIIGQLLHDELQ